MTDLALDPAGPVFWVECWDQAGRDRLSAHLGVALPAPGKACWGEKSARLLRHGPRVWLVRGDAVDPAAMAAALDEGGSVTAIGGGLARIAMRGSGWRTVLMHDAVFDAENPAFGPGSTATTLIAHVRVHIDVVADAACDVIVSASLARHLHDHFARTLGFGLT